MDSHVLKLYKQKLVEIMAGFDAFCSANGYSYFACSGTAIGAVRHHGFIPWDDDIDVYMPREDYDRLMANRQVLNGSNYAIKTLGDDGYIYAFAKFYDVNTTLVELKRFPTCVIGVYIDIFPLDEVSGTFTEIQRKKNLYDKYYTAFQDTYRKFCLKDFIYFLYHIRGKRCMELLQIPFMSDITKKKVREKFLRFEQEWAKDKGDKVMAHSCVYSLEKELFPKDWFTGYQLYDFENIKIRLTTNNDQYLTKLFGDYMTPPPMKKRISTHAHYYLNLKEGLSNSQVEERVKAGEYLVY